jgi:cell wall-associated NlpC family hydrolase
MTEQEFRDAIVHEAKTWLRTPYHHHGDVKGVGVDCAMILVRVYSVVGVTDASVDPRPYPQDWHLHRDSERYLETVMPYVREISREDVRPGDLVLTKFACAFSHSAIVVDYPRVIHAYAVDKVVTYADLHKDPFAHREKKYFSAWPEAAA